MIFVKIYSKLKNFIRAQTNDLETGKYSRLNNVVLGFDKGHRLVFEFIKEFASTFDGRKWGHKVLFGFRVVSRTLNSIRRTT
uniref:Alpha 1,4-glycosyltransferase domain-containing protein n=1 Tax=Cannabis sativa TaxID=3483 RepID=A0A803QY48_CANSA